MSRTRLQVWIAVPVVGIAIAAAVPGCDFGRAPDDGAIATRLGRIHAELVRLRRTGASEEQWAEFESRARADGKAIADDLERWVTSKDPQRQHLLWAVRDHLPRMIEQSRQDVHVDEEKFLENLDAAQRIIGTSKTP